MSKQVVTVSNDRLKCYVRRQRQIFHSSVGLLSRFLCMCLSFQYQNVRCNQMCTSLILVNLEEIQITIHTAKFEVRKLFAVLLNKRLIQKIENKLEDNQMGFFPNKPTIDNIFIVRQNFEKSHEHNIALYNIQVDYTHALDSVQRNKLIECLKKFDVPDKLIRLIALTLKATRARVKINGRIYSKMRSQTRRSFISNLVQLSY